MFLNILSLPHMTLLYDYIRLFITHIFISYLCKTGMLRTVYGENKQIWILLCSYSINPTCLAMTKISLLITGITFFNPLKLCVDFGQSLPHASLTHLSITLFHALTTLLKEIKCMLKPHCWGRTKRHKRQTTNWPPTLAFEDPARCQQKQTNIIL